MRKFYIIILFLSTTFYSHSQEWVQVASLPASFQTDHSFGFALNGYGYVVTGNTEFGQQSDRVYRYDPEEDSWTQIEDFPGGNRGFAIGDVYEGKAYFGFGTDGISYLNDLWVFDPEDESWTELAPCSCTGRLHPAMVGANGTISVGLGNNDTNLNDWWVYDIETDSWSQGEAFPGAARHHPYQFGIGDFAYAGLGHGTGFISDKWYRYDPATDEWDEMASIPAEGRVAGTQFSYNGKGYVLSGEGEDHRSMDEGEFWEYNPDTDTWIQLPSHPGGSRWAPASFVLNGEVYIINGPIRLEFTSTYQEDIYKFSLDDFVSVQEQAKAEGTFTMYPNPAGSLVKFDNSLEDITKVEIFDMSMKSVKVAYNKETSSVDVSDLSQGIYIVSINTDNFSTTERLIVE